MAMKASDICVGDWVEDGYKKVQVTSITCDGIVETTAAISNIEVVEPIPLTDDILVKNGFSEIHHPGTGATDEYSEWFLGGIKITEWLEDWKDHHFSTGGDDCSISFNYVHQLQHLLRLCGIEKELTI